MNKRSGSGLIRLVLMITLLLPTFFVTPQVQANPLVDIRYFYDALSPYGVWVNHPTYGEVWYPRNVSQDWRPYTDGYWAYTNDYGWLWVANEPWGWAPFHYGRWAWDDWYGWVWVPGRVWAPAWVFWRSGGGYAAWSPMPPNVVWQPGIGLNISYFDYDRDLRWDSWIVIRDYDLPHRHIRDHIFPSHQNREIINRTNHSQNITLINNTIVNQGVPVKQIEDITRQPIVPVVPRLHDRMDITSARHQDRQPDIIRLPMAAPTTNEIQQNEELARRLDGKRADGTRTEQAITDPTQINNQNTRSPGRLVGIQTQVPTNNIEAKNPGLSESSSKIIPQPAIPENPVVGLELDNSAQHKRHEDNRNQQRQVNPVQQPSQGIPESIPVQTPTERPPVFTQETVSPDVSVKPVMQHKSETSDTAQPAQAPIVIEIPAPEQPQNNTQRHQQVPIKEVIQPMQQIETLRPNETQRVQPVETISPQQIQNSQTTEIRQQEVARQQELQNQQQLHSQRQQAERAQQEAQQQQLQEAARQQELQNQQQMQLQRQQAERAQQEAQQPQLQETARQQELQNQQQMQLQRQQAERAQQEAQQQQQQMQEAARQQEMQNQQQMQAQQAERARREAEQRAKSEGANPGAPR